MHIHNQGIYDTFGHLFDTVEPLKAHQGYGTYLVRIGGIPKIMKAASGKRAEYLDNEARVLAALGHVDGITHLEEDLGYVNGYRGILKEYASGVPLCDFKGKLSPALKEKLRRTITTIHESGFAKLDISRANIVVEDGERGTIVDLDMAESVLELIRFYDETYKDIEMFEYSIGFY